jgi:hypothetical protein
MSRNQGSTGTAWEATVPVDAPRQESVEGSPWLRWSGGVAGHAALLTVVAARSGNRDADVDQPVTKPDSGRRVVAGPAAGNGRAGLCGAALARETLGAKAVALVAEGRESLVELGLLQLVHRSHLPDLSYAVI